MAEVIVVGAGASGMMAAGRASELGAKTLLLEKTDGPGKKILISGKSRCNLTNDKDLDTFIGMYGPNGSFLYGAFSRFFRDELLAFLRRYGVETRVERGGRIFPASESASDVVVAFQRFLQDQGTEMIAGTRVTGIEVRDGRAKGVRTASGLYEASAVVLATGGSTYPGTGSSGDGYRMARALGHAIVKLRPSLVPLVVDDRDLARSMQGVSLRNVRLTAYRCRASEIEPAWIPGPGTPDVISGRHGVTPLIESRQGEMMITHFGLGGPITLLMSLAVVDALERGSVSIAIDLKPALDRKQLHRRLQRDFDLFGRRRFRRILAGLLPQKMIDPFVKLAGIPPDKPAHQIHAEERERLVDLIKMFRFDIKGSLPLSRAIVTAGGVSLQEIDPRTMASRRIGGLFFCGEVMDIDADTGGYNLQAAFSTGYAAGEAAARHVGK
ncbi:MAG: NAD(P)/FAD-dependent oxidoreductase [Deltaproteobacteria bacterium]|nr:NAD(P)/FAD-dependent oxidoreductase [Deltaproteobacteria bacterium]